MKKTCTEVHYFCCPECGSITPLARKVSKRKEKFHKKRLYCYKCKKELNQVECKNQMELDEYKKTLDINNKKILYILSGVPASGKSTWAKLKTEMEPNVVWVSRDKIRFDQYVKTIQLYIDSDYPQIIADATQINERSRKKLLSQLNLKNYEVRIILFLTDINICHNRNKSRTGRKRVSEQVIDNLYDSLMQSNTYEEAYLIIRGE